jgi:hypothetical protein
VPVVGWGSSNEPLSITVAANTVVFLKHETANVVLAGNDFMRPLGLNTNGFLPIANNFIATVP